MTDSDHGYTFDNAVAGQRDRLLALEAVFDPGTFRQLSECGVAPRWDCLEVGAGAGSVARWLAERVGPEGSVLATDLDLTTFGEVGHHRLTTQVHDLTRDPLPEGRFDLVHVRFVLAWLPDPALAVRRLVGALRPGGVLVAEDLDFVSAVPEPTMEPESAEVLERVVRAHLAVVVEGSGFDPMHGRRLRSRLEDAALVDVAAEGRATVWRGGEPGGRTVETHLLPAPRADGQSRARQRARGRSGGRPVPERSLVSVPAGGDRLGTPTGTARRVRFMTWPKADAELPCGPLRDSLALTVS